MAITLNPQITRASSVSFKQGEAKQDAPAKVTTGSPAAEIKPAVKKKAGLTDFASKTAYAWINLSEMTKGIAKGAVGFALTGTAIAGVDALISGINKKAYKQIFTHPTKVMGVVGKVLAPVAGAMVFAGHMISTRLKINKKTADVDHKLYTNHREK